MTNYSNLFGSQFPSALITPGTHKDVDDTVVSIVNQYNSYINSGDTSSAYELYEANKSILEPYSITMSYVNYLEEEIYNTGMLALSRHQVIQSDREPAYGDEGTYWVQEYE